MAIDHDTNMTFIKTWVIKTRIKNEISWDDDDVG
jgi:hypothetical protein